MDSSSAKHDCKKNKNKLERKKNLKRLHEEGSPAIAGEEAVPEIRAKKRSKHKHKRLNTGGEVSFEGDDAGKRNQNNTGASSNENDEKRIAQSFQQMNKKMTKAGKMTSYQAKANKPKISGNMQYFVVEHAYQPPFNVLFDSSFFQLYILPNKDIVVDNIKELLGDKFSFCHTNCVLHKICQKHLLDFLLNLPHKGYRCRHDVDIVTTDFECLKEVVLENGLDDSLVLATGDSKFHSLMRRLSPIPIIYLDNLEAYFEGQTASRRNIVSKEKQNEGTSAGASAKENDEVRIDQEMSKAEKVISKQEKANKPKESLERKKTPAQKLIEEMARIQSSLNGEGACEDKKADGIILQNNSSAKKKSGQKVRRDQEIEDKKADGNILQYGKKKSGQKVKPGQELEEFFDSRYS